MYSKTTLFTLAVSGYTNGVTIGWTEADLLAQLKQADDIAHTCSTAHRRSTNSTPAVQDFDAFLNDSNKYTDSTFPFRDALWWADMEYETESRLASHTIEWARASEKFPDRTLWGETINPNDIGQGAVGNCGMMAALSGFAEYDQRVKKTFVNTQTSESGIYGVNLYALGVPHTVVIDDYLALLSGGENTIYGKLS